MDSKAQIVLDGSAEWLDQVLLERREHILLERTKMALLLLLLRAVIARVLRVISSRGQKEWRCVARRSKEILKARRLRGWPLVDL